MSIDRQLWSRSLQRPFFKASCWIQDQSRQKHKQTELYKDTAASSSVEDPVVFLRWWYRYQRRPVPELIERHSAGHQRHQHGGGAQAAAGVVEGVLLLQLPEPFIVVVLLSLFWMLPLYVECRCCLKP